MVDVMSKQSIIMVKHPSAEECGHGEGDDHTEQSHGMKYQSIIIGAASLVACDMASMPVAYAR